MPVPERLRALLLGAYLAGLCASETAAQSDWLGNLYVDPGKFRFLDCPGLSQRNAALTKREKELAGLMERARQDFGGAVVNALVYSADYDTTRAELRQVRETAASKKCDLNATPAASKPEPGPNGAKPTGPAPRAATAPAR